MASAPGRREPYSHATDVRFPPMGGRPKIM